MPLASYRQAGQSIPYGSSRVRSRAALACITSATDRGAGWGAGGFMLLPRTGNSTNKCGVLNSVTYPVLDKGTYVQHSWELLSPVSTRLRVGQVACLYVRMAEDERAWRVTFAWCRLPNVQ